MTKIYRFPHLHRFDGATAKEQAEYINKESIEAIIEATFGGYSDEAIIEVMDVMQACDTFLYNSRRTEEEILALMERHNAKDAARGYDKPREDA